MNLLSRRYRRALYARAKSWWRQWKRGSLGVLSQHPPRPLTVSRPMDGGTPPQTPISIVTPSYRQGRFIARTLRSVLDQDYPELEYVVQDGGSDDGTLAAIEPYRDRILKVHSERDNGQSHAINLGFAGTRGEVMAYLNSDDLLLPGSLAFVAGYFARHPDIDVLYGDRILIDEQDREIGRWLLPAHDPEVLAWADYIPQETLFWRRSVWDRVGGIDETFEFAMDWDLLLRFQRAGARIAHVERFLGAFRIHDSQKTSLALEERGAAEMHRLRRRELGHSPTAHEINSQLVSYRRAAARRERRWRLMRYLPCRNEIAYTP